MELTVWVLAINLAFSPVFDPGDHAPMSGFGGVGGKEGKNWRGYVIWRESKGTKLQDECIYQTSLQ